MTLEKINQNHLHVGNIIKLEMHRKSEKIKLPSLRSQNETLSNESLSNSNRRREPTKKEIPNELTFIIHE